MTGVHCLPNTSESCVVLLLWFLNPIHNKAIVIELARQQLKWSLPVKTTKGQKKSNLFLKNRCYKTHSTNRIEYN